MSTTSYYVATVATVDGKRRSLPIYGSSYLAALETAAAEGTVLDIVERKRDRLSRFRFPKAFKIAFLQAIRSHLEVGSSPGTALLHVIEAEESPKLRSLMQPAWEVLRAGGSFASAIELLGIYTGPLLAILQTGEATSTLPEAIGNAVDYLEKQQATWKTLIAKLTLIGFELSSGISFVAMIPMLAGMMTTAAPTGDAAAAQSFNDALAFVNAAVSFTLTSTWVSVAAVIAVAVCYSFGTPALQLQVNRLLNTAPLLRAIIVDRAMASSLDTLARMLRGRIMFADAADLAIASAPAPSVKLYWQRVRAAVLDGQPISDAMCVGPDLRHGERITLRAHQDSTQLARVLGTVARFRDDSYRRALARATTYGLWGMFAYGGWAAFLGYLLMRTQDAGLSSSLDGTMNGL